MAPKEIIYFIAFLVLTLTFFLSTFYSTRTDSMFFRSEQPNPIDVVEGYRQQIAELESKIKGILSSTTSKPKCVDDTIDKRPFICPPGPNGGLGNLMFTYASNYGIAKVLNMSVVIQKDHPLAKMYKLEARIVNSRCICDSAKMVYEGKHCSFNKNLFHISNTKNIVIGYYLQSWKYFENIEKDIRRQFTVSTKIGETATKIIENNLHKTNSYVSVGVHVRRGDIASNKVFTSYGYGLATTDYFHHAMNYFRKKYGKVVFLVCSDNFKWSKENIKGSDVKFMEGNSYEVDHAILSHCNHVIMSVGTFGWWAGFITKGEVIYYKYPAKEGSEVRKQFSADYSDFFLPGWIGMD